MYRGPIRMHSPCVPSTRPVRRWRTDAWPREITPVTYPASARAMRSSSTSDEHPRPETTIEQLAKLPTPFRKGGSVTAGNASGVNDGAAALIVASEAAAKKYGPDARSPASPGGATAGVPPRIMGVGPNRRDPKTLRSARHLAAGISASSNSTRPSPRRGSRRLRALGIADDAEFVNPNGGAIALGSPARHERRAHYRYCSTRTRCAWREAGPCHHVHWCGAGNCRWTRTGMMSRRHRWR